jgi:hypothetical protein
VFSPKTLLKRATNIRETVSTAVPDFISFISIAMPFHAILHHLSQATFPIFCALSNTFSVRRDCRRFLATLGHPLPSEAQRELTEQVMHEPFEKRIEEPQRLSNLQRIHARGASNC